MKEMNDDELQQWLDGKPQLSGDHRLNKDASAYRTLFEALNAEPEKGLPYDFSAKVTRQVAVESKRSNELKSNVIAAALFMAVIAIICIGMALWNPKQAPELLKFKWVLLLFPIIFIAIQYFDQKLVREKIFHSKK